MQPRQAKVEREVEIPKYTELYAPVLKLAAKGPITNPFVAEAISKEFNLAPEQRGQVLASGISLIADRTHWTIQHLFRGGALSRPMRGVYEITHRGRELLELTSTEIQQAIGQCDKVLEFRRRRGRPASPRVATKLREEHGK